MLKLYVITSDIQPPIFIKANSKEQALKLFTTPTQYGPYSSFKSKERFLKHSTFQVRELTMDLLMELAPNEFKLIPEIDF